MNKKISMYDLSQNIEMDIVDDYSLIPYMRFDAYLEKIQARKDKGYMTEFENNDVESRVDPALVLQGCQSMLCVIKSYHQPIIRKPKPSDGYLSDLACVEDYHTDLKRRLEKIVSQLKQYYVFDYKIIVDTSPLIDQAIAYYAGLGFIGKNHLLIHPKWGTQVVIGTILLTLDTSQSFVKPLESQCYECQKCIDYCVTKALKPNFEMDPKQCMSYIVQTKSEMSLDDQQKIYPSLYGCDVCQKVCPFYNAIDISPYPMRKLCEGTFDVASLFSMSQRQYKKQNEDYAFIWRHKDILLRNGIVGLSNKSNASLNQLIASNIQHDSASIRSVIYDSLFRYAHKFLQNKHLLHEQLAFEHDSYNRQKLLNYLKQLGYNK